MEGKQHPDRDNQFHFINPKMKEFQKQGQPVISVVVNRLTATV